MRALSVSMLTLLGMLAACGPRTSGLEGISCSTDSDCTPPLRCLAYAVFVDGGADGGCTSLGKICALPCASTTDCASLTSFVCSSECNSSAVCQPGQ
jgi:hypothetical protein